MSKINYYCDACGKGIHLKPSILKNGQRHYCSVDCKNKGITLFHSGVNHKGYSQQKVECDYCGKETSKPLNVLKKNKNNFCSIACKDKYFAEVTSKSDETRERTRNMALDNLNKGLIKTDTSIQIKINELLTYNNIKFENEYILDNKYAVDNFLSDCNLIIENQGDYWHTNPNVYSQICYDRQLKGMRSDKSKHTYIKKYSKIEILYLWESDINNNINLCEKLILEYIKNNGVLKNYESFNYKLENNELVLNDIITKPYREYPKEYISTITDLSIKQKPEYYITFKCDICDKEKTQKICVYNKNKHHYCCRECSAKGNSIFKDSKIIEFNCDYCGNKSETYKSQYDVTLTHFCNPQCRGLYVKKVVKMGCENCNKEIEVTEKQQRLYKHHFCCFDCNVEYKRKNKKT